MKDKYEFWHKRDPQSMKTVKLFDEKIRQT